MKLKRAAGGEYMIFPLRGGGLHISQHPGETHLRRGEGTILARLDLQQLAGIDNALEVDRFRAALEKAAYWPSHRADLLAMPGPPGKSLAAALVEPFQTDEPNVEVDLVDLVATLFSPGRWFKVGHHDRSAFFDTELGQGSVVVDSKEDCLAAYAPFFPGRPLMRFDGESFRPWEILPPPLRPWHEAIELGMHSWEQEPSSSAKDFFTDPDQGALDQIRAVLEDFQVVRWRPGVD